MKPDIKIIIQNELDIAALDENFYLVLMESIMSCPEVIAKMPKAS